MKRTVYITLAALILGYAGVCAAMYLFQRSLLYYPQSSSVTAPESTMTLPVDGAELVVTVRPHNGPRAIVYFGGNAEDVSRSLASCGKEFPDYALYLTYYRGYGGSTGKPTEKANVADGIAIFGKVHTLHPEVAIVGRSLGTGIAVQVASRVAASHLVLVTPFDSVVGIAAQIYWYLPVHWIAIDTYELASSHPT